MKKRPCCRTAAQVRADGERGITGFECVGCGAWRIIAGKAVR